MSIYHLHAKMIGRASGRSAVAAAAYRSASEMEDERLVRSYDFTNKSGVVHSEVLLPEGAPARLLDRSVLWNEVERVEVRRDAQLAREVEFSIPREMSQADGIRLARDFVREQFVDRGMVADLNVHWDVGPDGEAKPHAHVMLATRAVGPDGFGRKVREWNRTELLLEWRERWASLANERLAELGHDLRIDHRSYDAQGIALEPQNKIGPAGARREGRGEDAERAAEHLEIARRNGARIIADPDLVLAAITRQQSTFTRQDLARFVNGHTADAEQFAAALAKVEASAALVRAGVDGRGRERFTTREMLGVEQRLEAASQDLAVRSGHGVGAGVQARSMAGAVRRLEGEQLAAFEHVTAGADVSAVVGYAGTGKSTMLGVARAAWEASGYRVRGAALSGIAAEGLEGGAGIESRTLASLEYGWARGRDLLTRADVLVVDEAGMVGSRQMERVLSAVREAGAKVVLVGDPEQLQAIEAGAAFRAVTERVGAVEITEVRRQREAWQQAATRELATGRTAAALVRYEAAGMVHAHATTAEARTQLVGEWNQGRQAAPVATRIMLAHRRVDVRALNEQARALRREAGELGVDRVLSTGGGERAFAEGDRVYFLKNERSLGVKNGTLGTVERIAGDGAGASLLVRLDAPGGAGRGRAVSFDLKDYAEIDHGYAATVHKSQGVTVDQAHLLATRGMDRHMAYVGLSRHRESVSLHWSREDMGSREGLDARLGRERLKDTSLDYAAGGEALSRAYAERRGLVPESEIILRERQAEAPAPRRSKFAGLKLGAGRVAPDRDREAEKPALPKAPRPRQAEAADARVAREMADYARAWSDAARMERAGLPVLPHQEQALERAGQALEATRTGLSRDVRAALERTPELAQGYGQKEGMAALGRAADAERRERLALDERGRAAVRAWTALEREYEAAGRAYEWKAQRQIGTRMEALAKELKRDPLLDSVLRERGRELGIAEGSRLDRVVQAREIDRALTRAIDIEHGPRLRSGPSLGR